MDAADDNGDSEFEYFKEAINFFKHFQWLYNMPVTKILLNGALNLFPFDWLNTLIKLENDELNSLVAEAKIQSDWPASLIDFVTCCKKLNKLPGLCTSVSSVKLPDAFLKKTSIKKQHEIFHLAQLVHKQCNSRNVSFIVDLGSGLGYVSQLLNHAYGYKVLGLESNAQNVKAAKARQKALFPESLLTAKYICSNVTENSSESIQVLLQQQFDDTDGSICLLGLHACGDLSVHILQVFKEMRKAQLLVLVSCCYHKLTLLDNHKNCNKNSEEKEYFNHFPLSKTFKKAIITAETDIGKFCRRPFLRLACQETSDRWKTMSEEAHKEHSFHVLARAVLELYGVKNKLELKKLVRKATRKSQCSKFDIYLQDCTKRYSYVKQIDKTEVPWDDKMKLAIMTLWESNANQQKNVELYTALQLLLQNAAESLVLFDRLCFSKEHGFEACIYSTMDRSLSPRCYALVSNKKQNS